MTTHTTAVIAVIGAEILSGKVDDANGPFLIRALRARDIEVLEMRVIGDTLSGIASCVRQMKALEATHFFTTGGIGPTHDDVTIEGIALGLNRRVVRDEEAAKRLKQHYGDRLNAARLKMAEVPEGGRVYATSNGFPYVQVENITIFPGVPSFLRDCFEHASQGLKGLPFFTRSLFLSASEGDIADMLTDVQKQYPHLAVGSYPRFEPNNYHVKITIDGRESKDVENALLHLKEQLRPEWVLGVE